MPRFIRDRAPREVYRPAPVLPETFDATVLPIDKPSGCSSFDVIRRLRRLLGVRKMGHAGTLDPMATGLLLVLVGRATRLMDRLVGLPKTYEGTMRLGETTSTYDAEGEVVVRSAPFRTSDRDILRLAKRFVGTIEQHTPVYAAVRVGGERLYEKARRGEAVEPPKRLVSIQSFDILGRHADDVHFAVECSKGTYVRSLAHEFGQALGVGAHLVALRRTAIGDFSVSEAWTMQAIGEALA